MTEETPRTISGICTEEKSRTLSVVDAGSANYPDVAMLYPNKVPGAFAGVLKVWRRFV